MLLPSDITYGVILGNAFVFEEAGDVLPWHEHGVEDQHIIVVAKGELRMEVRGEEPSTIRAGDLIEVGAGVCHQFTALTDDARMFTMCKDPEAAMAAYNRSSG